MTITIIGEKEVILPREEYDELFDDALFLSALREAGVDSWEGYDEAVNIYDSYTNERG